MMHQTFPNLPDVLSEYLLSKFLSQPTRTPEISQVILSCQVDEFLIGLLEKSDDIQSVLNTVLLAL